MPAPGYTPAAIAYRPGRPASSVPGRLVLGLVVGLMLGTVATPGCGKRRPRRIPVSGTVTFQDLPVTEGEVTFFSQATGFASVGVLDETGRFAIREGLPADRYVVAVAPPSPQVAAGASWTTPAKEYPNIPPQYRSVTTSPLQADLDERNHEFAFPLTAR